MALGMICFAVLVIANFSVVTSAEVLVGVSGGELIEYNVTCTGEVPKDHDVERAKIEVISVEGKEIDIKLTSIYFGGVEDTVYLTLNLETGQIGDAFIIPANLSEGERFLEQTEGFVTISGVEQRIYAGSKRTVVTANTTYTTFYWDRSTGFLVEATSTYTDFTITTKAEKTNIWQISASGLDPIFSIILVILMIALILVIVMRRKMKK
jgi:hypothetical protein